MKIFEILKPEGTYAGVRFSEDTKNSIKQFIKDNEIKNPVDIYTLHATLLFSRKYLPNYKAFGEINPPWLGEPGKLQIWDNKDKTKKVLVLSLKCKELTKRHHYLMKLHKAKYDYPQYNPHITISYDCGDLDIEKLFKIDNYLKEIEIIKEYKESLDLS